MKILLVYPSWTGQYGIWAHFGRRQGTWPPLNLALLAAILEREGHEVEIIDAEAERLSEEKTINKCLEVKPDVVGLSGMSPFFHLSKNIVEGVKQSNKDIVTIIGGPHMTIMQEKALFPFLDYGFIGEVEHTLPEFFEVMEKDGDLKNVKGLIYRNNGDIINTGKPSLENRVLSTLPYPARHLLNMKNYHMGTLRGRLPFTSIQGMRGCPWKCIFCASEALDTTVVSHSSSKRVVDEIEQVISNFGIRHFYFIDEVLTLNKPYISGICDEIIERELDITFEGATRANQLNEPLVEKMKEAGLIRLAFGLETVDPGMREKMQKKVPLKYYTEYNKLLNKYNIECLNSVMLGLPGETRQTINKTLDWLAKAKEVKQANFAIAVPYPGTEFHDMAVSGDHDLSLISSDWAQYRRYGSAVTQVGNLSPEDLVELQNEGFVKIYSASHRWKSVLTKHGIVGGLLMLLRVLILIIRRWKKSYKPFDVHPNLE
tara:strand:+ start:1893 stop:3350 length:1458 start_codon:yes stop_codon:yes gene_type:complete